MNGFPTREQVDTRIAHCRANPADRPPSGDFCRSCLSVGMAHCSDPSRAGDPSGCQAREPYDSAAASRAKLKDPTP